MVQNNDVHDVVDVSVIIPTYNDVKHLRHAIRSVVAAATDGQRTLRTEILVADDGSTDGTERLMRRITNTQLQYVRLEHRTGAAGAPRNRALELARGRFITMLDSDDVLLPHGLVLMFDEAERTGAELTLGATHRRYMISGKTTRWMPQHYRVARSVSGIAEAIDLVGDTNSTAILYTRAFFERTGLRYREGVRYEDLDFTTAALVMAQGINVITDVIYEWRIYPPRVRRSITQQREDASSLHARLAAFDAIDAMFEPLPAAVGSELRDAVMRKFLRHDVFVYLGDAMNIDDALLDEYIALLAPRVRVANNGQRASVSAMKQVAIGRLLANDRQGIRLATQYDRALGALGGAVAPRCTDDESVIWSATGAELDDAHQTEVVRWPLLDTPIAAVPILHQLREVTYRRSQITMRGESWLPWGVNSPIESVTLTWRRYQEREVFAVPVTWRIDEDDPSHGTWEATFSWPKGMALARPNRWDAWITIATHLSVNASHIRTDLPRDPKRGVCPPGRDTFLGRRYGLFAGGFNVLAMKKVVKHKYGTAVQNALWVWGAELGHWLSKVFGHRDSERNSGAIGAKTRWIGDAMLDETTAAISMPDVTKVLATIGGDIGAKDERQERSQPRRRVRVIVPSPGGQRRRASRSDVSFRVADWREAHGFAEYLIVDRRHLAKTDVNYGPPIRRIDAPFVWDIGGEGIAVPAGEEIAAALGVPVLTAWPE